MSVLQNNRWYNIFVIIVLVLLGIWLWRRGQQAEEATVADSSDQEVASRADDFLSTSGFTLPQDSDRVNLQDATGGTSTGIVTRSENSQYTVLAALPELSSGWYQAWLTTSDGQNPVSLGNLTLAKGGLLLESSSSVDQESYTHLIITKEQTRDNQPETIVLEGDF